MLNKGLRGGNAIGRTLVSGHWARLRSALVSTRSVAFGAADKVQGLGFGVQDLRFRLEVLGFMIFGFWVLVQGER